MAKKHPFPSMNRARQLRASQTRSEGLLWSLLRARQLCGLKFRRQHPIGPFFADFACVSERVVIEIDGASHDATGEADIARQDYLRDAGWCVLRYTDQEVEADAEAVARDIARQLGCAWQFRRSDG